MAGRSRRRSIADLQRRYDELHVRDPRTVYEILSPSDADVYLFRTSEMGCLSHIARFVIDSVASYRTWSEGGYHRSVEAECGIVGTLAGRHPMVVIDPADETFACHVCVERAVRHGLPTFGLIPDTGCSATGGERFRPKRRPLKLPPPKGPIVVPAADVDRFLAALEAIETYVKSLDEPWTV